MFRLLSVIALETTRASEQEMTDEDQRSFSLLSVNPQEFRCHICDRIFSRRSRLDAHVNTHLGLKPHKCDGRCGDPDWYAVFVVEFSR
jgi:hypothetical protein